MSTWTVVSNALVVGAVALSLMRCSKEPSEATPLPVHSAPPVVSTPEPVASASAPVEPPAPKHDCPTGTEGEGTSKAPCEAKGTARMMEIAWTGKTTDQGPFFKLVNKSDQTIVYGRVAAYFYDKAGKQLQVVAPGGSDPKPHPYQLCSGNIFGGVMKPGEKAVMTFSCVRKEHVPADTATIEAEVQTVGFTGESEKRADWFWRNQDLTPDERPKGGAKKK